MTGLSAKPVVVTVYGEWASHLAQLEIGTTFPLPVGSQISYMFPATTQRFYDRFLEKIFPASSNSWRSSLSKVIGAAPALAHPLLVVAFDFATASAFLAHEIVGLAALMLPPTAYWIGLLVRPSASVSQPQGEPTYEVSHYCARGSSWGFTGDAPRLERRRLLWASAFRCDSDDAILV